MTSAKRGIVAKSSRPSLAMRSNSFAWSKRRIFSTHSTVFPSPPKPEVARLPDGYRQDLKIKLSARCAG